MTVHGRNGDGAPRTWLTALVWLGLLLGLAAFAAGAYSQPQALLPIWARKSWNWFWVLLALAVLATVIQRRTRRPVWVVAVAGGGVLLGAFGLAATTSVAVITLTALALGSWLLDRAGASDTGDTSAPPIATTAVGLAALALLLGVAAHFGVNIAPAYLALSAFSIWLGRRRVATLARHVVVVARTRSFEATPPFAAGVSLWLGFGIAMYYSALPERYHDALAMHLVIPHALELFGRWNFDVADNVWAVWPLGGDLLFGWAYVLAGEAGAKLLNLALLILTCGLVVEAKFVSRPASLAAVAAFMLMPLAILETASLFVENALTLFLAAAIVFAARLPRNPGQGVVAIAIALGGAIVVKLYGVVALGALAIALATAGTWRAALGAPARAWGLCLVAALLGVWPYAHAWIVTGNPIFPFYNAVFKSPLYPLENFRNIYPGGLSWRDLYDLTFSSSRYLEAGDGALGFVLTLLLPAGLIVVARRGTPGLRMATVAALSYLVVALMSTRYLRYLYPALPWLFLVAAAPLDFFTAKGRMAVAALLALVVGAGIARIPSAGWIIGDFNLPMAFSPRDKEAYADIQVPMRVLGRTQAAIGDRNSKTAIFGAPVGAYVKGRPIYAHWYHPVLDMQVHSVTSVEEAARALAALNVTHVMFDLRETDTDFKLWQEAAARHGRLVHRVPGGELYEFDAASVAGVDLLDDGAEPWLGWQADPPLPPTDDAHLMSLPPGKAISRGIDIAGLRAGTPVVLAVSHECAARSSVRVQINWLAQSGDILRTDAVRSECGPSPSSGQVRAAVPPRTRLAYAFFVNDGPNAAQLFDARMDAVTDAPPRKPR